MSTQSTVVGYEIYGADNRGYFYAGADVEACRTCGLVLDTAWVSPTFVPPRRQFQLSHTYDGVTIVGEHMANSIGDWPGVHLDPLPAAPGFSRLSATQTVEFDMEWGRPERTHWCETCRRFTQIALGGRRWLTPGVEVPDGLARTDLVVGSAFDHPSNRKLQEPLLVVNIDYWARLNEERFGVHCDPVNARCAPGDAN